MFLALASQTIHPGGSLEGREIVSIRARNENENLKCNLNLCPNIPSPPGIYAMRVSKMRGALYSSGSSFITLGFAGSHPFFFAYLSFKTSTGSVLSIFMMRV